jgi:hypothetical protein
LRASWPDVRSSIGVDAPTWNAYQRRMNPAMRSESYGCIAFLSEPLPGGRPVGDKE